MNKKSTKVLSSLLATSSVLTTVMGATTVFAEEVDNLYAKAYTATEAAEKTKTQESINVARAAVRELNAALKNNEALRKQLVGGLSGRLDPLQQAQFVAFYDILYKEDKATLKEKLTQKEINEARQYVEAFLGAKENEQYVPAWSTAVDKFQQANVNEATALVKKAIETKAEADVKAARKVVDELLTSTNADAKTAAEGLNIQVAELEKNVSLVSVKPIGVKKMEVKFNKAVDTEKAKITLNRGIIAVNTDKITFSEDKTTAIVETTATMWADTYKVTVAGLTEKALVAEVKVEDEKVAKIEVVTKQAPVVNTAGATDSIKVQYKAVNQYGETKTIDASKMKWTPSLGTAQNDDGKGTFEIINIPQIAGMQRKVIINGVYIDGITPIVVTSEVEVVAKSIVSEVKFGAVTVDKNDSTKRYAALTVLDQYGNNLNDAVEINKHLVFSNSNERLVVASQVQKADDGSLYVELTSGADYKNGGTAIVTLICKNTGKMDKVEVSVAPAAALKSFKMIQPEGIVKAGTNDKDVVIPFEAFDQFGNKLTKFDDLKVMKFTGAYLDEVLTGKDKGKAVLRLGTGVATKLTEGYVSVTATHPAAAIFQNMLIKVEKASEAKALVGLNSKYSKTTVTGQAFAFEAKNFNFQDQYGETISCAKLPEGVSVKAVSYNETGAQVLTDLGNVAVDVTKAGTKTVTFALVKDGKVIAGTEKSETFTIVARDAFESYAIGEIAPLYVGAEGYKVSVPVFGVMKNGAKVQLPAEMLDIAVATVNKKALTIAKPEITKGDVTADDLLVDGKVVETKAVDVTVNVIQANGIISETLKGKLTLTSAAPKASYAEFNANVVDGIYDVEKTGSLSRAEILAAVIDTATVVDQYGVAGSKLMEDATIIVKSIEGGTVTENGKTGMKIVELAAGKTAVIEITAGSVKLDLTIRATGKGITK
ncbi:hypothetical protein SAMN02745248_02138 [Hathewaya proteolytica DSM 3090]|uniref:Ig-like domain (Group 3) n=1 Tax=Hathewaya proteolytica DSM 3090 TaxID=1121331 RepID=A0A1M6QWL8_9CLOT|nr:hypothetical protein [Hathewaya proteolytica]SHK24659.1 hypothetical protein SAMN02745248_02138 [Hathewaya proteolytica DSM 3090]